MSGSVIKGGEYFLQRICPQASGYEEAGAVVLRTSF
jgi:hypothetical protein